MTLIERIGEDMKSAMRARDTVRLGALRMAKAALMNREVERGRALDAPESQQVIAALIKQRRDSIEQFEKGGRSDLADKERAEIDLLQVYLPPPVATDELEHTGVGLLEGRIASRLAHAGNIRGPGPARQAGGEVC